MVFLFSASVILAIGTQSTGFKTSSSAQDVSFYDSCASVRHTGSTSYFVPTKTISEWSAFKSNVPADVTLTGGALSIFSRLYTDGFNAIYGYNSNSANFGATISCETYGDYYISSISQPDPRNQIWFVLTHTSDIPNTNSTFSTLRIKNAGGTTLAEYQRANTVSFLCSPNYSTFHTPGSRACMWQWNSSVILNDNTTYLIEIE